MISNKTFFSLFLAIFFFVNLPFVWAAGDFDDVSLQGKASWYVYKGGMFAASPDFIFGTKLKVVSVANPAKSIVVTVNDYGPDRKAHPDRVIDLDKVAFAELAPLGAGVIEITIEPLLATGSSLIVPAAVSSNQKSVVPASQAASKGINRDETLLDSKLFELRSGQLWQDRATGGVYWVKNQTKKAITEASYLKNIFNGLKIIPKDRAVLDALETLPPLAMPDGSLLKSPTRSAVYLLSGQEKRLFANAEAFLGSGYIWGEVMTVSDKLLAGYQDGTAIATPAKTADKLGLTARSAIVIDAASGQVVYAKEANRQLPLASLTKLVAMKVFLDTSPNLDKAVSYKTQDEEYNYQYAEKSTLARLRVSNGETMTIRDLLYSAVIGSANNAVETLVRVSGLKRADFIAKMNRYAKDLGAKQTVFVEPTGLSPDNLTSAADYALIAKATLADGNLAKVSQTKTYSFTTINKKIPHNLKNSNSLFWSSNLAITGSKTGFLYESLYCLMTRAKDSKGREFIAITFGVPEKAASFSETKKLLDKAFAG
jgi:D-alanyl-D-alanine carboxypeptidase